MLIIDLAKVLHKGRDKDRPDPGATAQYDQHLRDAAATGTARALQFAIDIQNVQAAAANATSIAHANATDAAIAEAQMTEQSHANATATAARAVEATRVQIALSAEQADADRARWAADSAWGLRLIGPFGITIGLDGSIYMVTNQCQVLKFRLNDSR